MEPIREAEMQTQPGKRLNEESKKSGKGWPLTDRRHRAGGCCWRPTRAFAAYAGSSGIHFIPIPPHQRHRRRRS